jgi:FAD/FMN-containing dehydrogenase
VDDCRAKRLPLVDYGVAHAGLGHPPPPRHIRLTQRAPGSALIIEHHQRDFTVRAAAGTTIADLQAALRPTRQFVPIEADDDLTLGEVISHNVYGALRLGYGGVRDLLLGLGYIDGLGRDIRAGGRTVKNVAGYDLTRFMVGSLGEFGVIHEATLRTYTIPESVLVADLEADDLAVVDQGMTGWLTSDAAAAYHYLRWDAGHWHIRMGYFGDTARAALQLQALERRLGGAGPARLVSTVRLDFKEEQNQRNAQRGWRRTVAALVKIVVPPAHTGALCGVLRTWAQQHGADGGGTDRGGTDKRGSASLSVSSSSPGATGGTPGVPATIPTPALHIAAAPATGIVFTGGDLDLAAAVALDQVIRDFITSRGGVCVWMARPENSETIEPFFPTPPEWPIFLRLKKAMDPLGILNPGRCVPVPNGGAAP